MTAITTILSVKSTTQLSEFSSIMIPNIWENGLHTSNTCCNKILNPKRHSAFKSFVQKVLKATQISCTCIILALYYVQRLRKAYPSVRASIGSEVRLFTTSLVLANKYLDDNTFTNKTWSEVSSIPVSELNIMEMEFLSALDYNIYIPTNEFYSWVNQCQQWWNNMIGSSTVSTATIPTATTASTTSFKRSSDCLYESITNTNTNTNTTATANVPYKKRLIDQLYYYPQNTVCKPIISWSSSVSVLSNAAAPCYSNNYTNNTSNNNNYNYNYFTTTAPSNTAVATAVTTATATNTNNTYFNNNNYTAANYY